MIHTVLSNVYEHPIPQLTADFAVRGSTFVYDHCFYPNTGCWRYDNGEVFSWSCLPSKTSTHLSQVDSLLGSQDNWDVIPTSLPFPPSQCQHRLRLHAHLPLHRHQRPTPPPPLTRWRPIRARHWALRHILPRLQIRLRPRGELRLRAQHKEIARDGRSQVRQRQVRRLGQFALFVGCCRKKNNFKSVKCEPKEGEEGRTNRHQTPPKTPSPTRPHAPRPATPSTPHPPKTPSRSRPTRPA